MRWSIVEPKKLLEPAFGAYSDRMASVEGEDGQHLGYLITYAEHVEEFVGLRGLRPRLWPTEVFKGWFMPEEGRADEVWPLEAADLDPGQWGNDRLRWLEGAEREAAWAKYLAEWGPHESSQLRDG